MKINIGIKNKANIAMMRIRTLMHFGVTNEQIDDWFRNTTTFFLLGLGRSGTEFFAKLLNMANHTNVYHEPVSEDFSALVKAHKSSKDALNYMKTFRKKAIYILGSKKGVRIYGESNSNLRFHAEALKSTIPNVKIIHVVRDGRNVVRSIMPREHYTNGAKGHFNITPSSDDPVFIGWQGLSRFEKICWLWVNANRRVCEFSDITLNFEKLISDYNYFRENIVNYLGIELSENCWEKEVHKPKNITKKHSIPHWTEWEDDLAEKFWRICKDEMHRYGYIR